MRKFFINLLCCFVPSRRMRHQIRKRMLLNNDFVVTGNNNIIVTIDENGVQKNLTHSLPGIRVRVTGNNNTVKIHTPVTAKDTSILCANDNCFIEIGPTVGDFNVHISCYAGDSQRVVIGKNTTIGDAHIILNEQAQCLIGEDCMLSGCIRIWPADGHSVLDATTHEVLNAATKPLVVENHVWIGEGARLTKNAHIHDNCIVAGGACACKDYKESGCIIAGNPGRIVKRNITWSRCNPLHIKQKGNL